MRPSKEPLRITETIVLLKRTVLGDSGDHKSEGNHVLPSGTCKGMLLHNEQGWVEIPTLNDKDEDQQPIKGSLLAHTDLGTPSKG